MPTNRLRQIDCVRIVLEEARSPMTLYAIQHVIQKRWKRLFADASISARVREIRRDLEKEGLTIAAAKIKGSQSYEYWIEPLNREGAA